jgi:hypothetical protein
VESPVLGDGYAGFGERPGETDRWQHRNRAPGRLNRAHFLGVCATREPGADLVADHPSGDPSSERGNATGALQTGVRRGTRRRVVEALPLQDIGAVHSRSDDLNQDLALGYCRVGDFSQLKDLGSGPPGAAMVIARIVRRYLPCASGFT